MILLKILGLLKKNNLNDVVKGLYCDASKEKDINKIIKFLDIFLHYSISCSLFLIKNKN